MKFNNFMKNGVATDSPELNANFICFSRTWWIENPAWPDGLEPGAGPKKYHKLARFKTENQAREFCQQWNARNDPGRYSLKMEYETNKNSRNIPGRSYDN